MTYFVKLLGSTDMPMPNHPWGHRNDAEDEVRFPAKPAPVEISPGDGLVYYAVGGYKRVFATARIEGAPKLKVAPKTVIEEATAVRCQGIASAKHEAPARELRT
jgi:hypothetical protein